MLNYLIGSIKWAITKKVVKILLVAIIMLIAVARMNAEERFVSFQGLDFFVESDIQVLENEVIFASAKAISIEDRFDYIKVKCSYLEGLSQESYFLRVELIEDDMLSEGSVSIKRNPPVKYEKMSLSDYQAILDIFNLLGMKEIPDTYVVSSTFYNDLQAIGRVVICVFRDDITGIKKYYASCIESL